MGHGFDRFVHFQAQFTFTMLTRGVGNVQVSDIYLGQPGDPQVPRSPSPKVREMWKEWAATCQREETPTLVQLCHPGRQSPPGAGTRSFWTKTIAPSPVPLNLGNSMLAKGLSTLLFGTPKEMTSADVDEVVEQFVAGAKMSYEAGFKGVELHGASVSFPFYLAPHRASLTSKDTAIY